MSLDARGVTFGGDWDQTRCDEASAGRSIDLDDIWMSSAFEGGNGMDMGRIGPDHYFVRCEPDPGEHRFSGKSYYFCVAVRNPLPVARRVRIRIAANGWNYFGDQSRHYVIRRRDAWSVVGAESCRGVPEQPDWADIDLLLPAGTEHDATVFVSNFHWNRWSELMRWIEGLPSDLVRRRTIGESHQGRPLIALEIGDNPVAPVVFIARTSQPSEQAATLVLRALVEHVLRDTAEARWLRDNIRFRFVPMPNPDGSVMGLMVTDAAGRFPGHSVDLVVQGAEGAPQETRAIWAYLGSLEPTLYLEWHSNNWSRRPGHMLLRYRDELIADAARRRAWVEIEDALLRLPATHHKNFTSHSEGPYQRTMGFHAAAELGCIATRVKTHERIPIAQSISHGIGCLELIARRLAGR